MSRKNINFDDEKIKKNDFYKNKKIKKIEDINANNILISKKESYGTKNSFKYFIGYNDNECIKLPQMTGYARKFNENVTMSFKVNDKQLLKNYNIIWEKTENLMGTNFESKPVYGDDDKYIKTKMKIDAKNLVTNFHNKCLSITMIDSVIKANKNIILKYF